ncbi:MAG: dihydropteroate synthase [Crocinitomix sp.]|nr:dihydropteroate synthase [Crocinitomix sp.]
MGILNTTPDSFYAQSRIASVDDVLQKATEMIADGAEILDIGGYSSRPGATAISVEEELGRTTEVIRAVKTAFPEILISIDTFRSEVALAAVLAGADIINDISGGMADPKIFEVAGKYKCPYILMHMRGTPQTMMHQTDYTNLMEEVEIYFRNQLQKAKGFGIKEVILDLGFGFSKNSDQNYLLLKNLAQFHSLNCPILVGISRKSMIYKPLSLTAEDSLNGTTVLNTVALLNGAQILRVHDVKPAVEAVKLVGFLNGVSG